ncbi:DUF485 domain-containing protein [Bacillus sp. T33-2]|uniref:DUF485 domain-containing protein n=1 Tax=Bacillus sp. T33-2 TaxID=2054168 RepID=UPI000C778CC3|nr:DUF485 domain-containing protein [Bacillus sp. T33-2]PLR96640.1 DUF485 domain-containing protein [Bacillus sp. T33-2]
MNENALKKAKHSKTSLNYTKIVRSSSFQQLLHEKKKFLLPFSLFFLAFYFTLPILTAYTSVLNNPAIGAVSWAWVFAFAQFIMTWSLCIIYTKRAARFDKLVDQIKRDNGRGEQS